MKPIKIAIENASKKIFKKQGYIFFELMNSWSVIIGKKEEFNCYPYRLFTSKEKNKQIQVLTVIAKNIKTSIDITYKQDMIVERIAIHFGRRIIDKINVKLVT